MAIYIYFCFFFQFLCFDRLLLIPAKPKRTQQQQKCVPKEIFRCIKSTKRLEVTQPSKTMSTHTHREKKPRLVSDSSRNCFKSVLKIESDVTCRRPLATWYGLMSIWFMSKLFCAGFFFFLKKPNFCCCCCLLIHQNLNRNWNFSNCQKKKDRVVLRNY